VIGAGFGFRFSGVSVQSSFLSANFSRGGGSRRLFRFDKFNLNRRRGAEAQRWILSRRSWLSTLLRPACFPGICPC
jgi:hypothetical protein